MGDVFCEETGSNLHKVILFTVPKSGSWMYINVLKHFDLVFTGIDIRPLSVMDHRGAGLKPRHKSIQCPLQKSISKILPGQFAMSHMPPDKSAQYFTNWKKVFTYRNARMVLISAMRWQGSFGNSPKEMLRFVEEKGKDWLRKLEERSKWLQYDDVYHIRFETFVQGSQEEQFEILDGLANFLDVKAYNKSKIIKEVFEPTRTYTGHLSTLEEYWSDEVEDWFVSKGGKRINTLLGYEE